MREDVKPTIATEEELVNKVRSKLIQVDTFPGQQSTEPPTINKNIGPNSLISMKTFAIDGPELLPRGGTWALKHACELAEVIGDNSREMFMLTRKDFTHGDKEVPFVVVVSQKASKEEAISAFKRAIEILEKPPEANPEPTKGWAFPSDGLSAGVVGSDVPGGGTLTQAPKRKMVTMTVKMQHEFNAQHEALVALIERQQNRNEELAKQLGRLGCVTDTDDEHWKRLLAATKSKGASEAIAKVEALVEYSAARGLHLAVVLDDIKYPSPTKADAKPEEPVAG